jgi:FtsP/CotA-like multicopper oxidase with cupredoxin domain
LGAAAAAQAAVGRFGVGSASAAPATGLPLVEPQVVTSANGLLSVTLRAALSHVEVDGVARRSTVYDGLFPARTLSVQPGDLLRVNVVNQMSQITNLHTHGLHVSGEGNADNVFVHIEPNGSFQYEYPIPADHPWGLYWYHPHAHGTGAQQVFGGMAGALVIRGPEVPGLRDRLMVLQTTEFDDSGRVRKLPTPTLDTNVRLVNGQRNPTIDIVEGELQRWRFVNASINSVFHLSLRGHRFTQVASDGNPFGAPVRRRTVLIAPGQRADLLVRGGAPGLYPLKALAFASEGGLSTPETVIATVQSVAGSPGPEPDTSPLFEPLEDLRGLPVDRTRLLRFSTLGGFMIDGQSFDPDRVDQTIEFGALEEWTIENASNVFHPFHIHINPFQVTHVNGVPVDVQGYEDTVKVDPFGSVTFRTRFVDYPGRSVYHCHLIQHSDEGMMGVFEVLQPDGTAVASTFEPPEGTAYCRLA